LRPRPRALVAFLAAALLVVVGSVGPVAAATMPAGDSPAPLSVVAPQPKVVIIVGPTGGATSNYKSAADAAASVALQYTSNVVKVYSPNATWSAVQAAVTGAAIVVYLGHGNGWPSPYKYDPTYATKDGFGLNDPNNLTNADPPKYYGEPYVSTLQFAPNAVVILNHLCYASGNSEPQNADPTLDVAKQRVDNYGAGFLKGGAAAVIAEGHGSIGPIISAIFTSHQTLFDAWNGMPDSNGGTFTFASSRTAGATAAMDPDQPGKYYRSFVGSTTVTTDDVVNATPPPMADSVRLGGTDRFGTSAKISAANFDPGVPVAFVATGMNFPDALAGAAAAGKLGAPILLVTRDTIPDSTAKELARLQPGRIVVLGSAGVVSDAVATALGAYTAGGVSRLAGPDRYGTAAAVSAAFFDPGVDLVFIATGANFPDALAGAAVAGRVGAPILLVRPTSLPSATATELARLAPKRIVVLGSTDAVGAGVATQLATYASEGVTRLAGSDRYATAAAVSAAFFDQGADLAFVATGLNFPDALAGAAAAGSKGAPILLVRQSTLPASTATETSRLGPQDLVVLGSSGAVSDAVVTQVALAAYK
jgi:putative cell wall-binding protein